MLYAALGDSITYGYSAESDTAKYVNRIQRSLLRQPVHVFLCAKPGWTSRQLLKAVKAAPECIWDEAKLVTIIVGGNDILRATPWLLDAHSNHAVKVSERLYSNLTEIIRTVKRPQSTTVVGTLYNPFPNSLLAEELTDAINKAIRIAASRERVVLADIRRQFRHREQLYIDSYRNGTLRDFRIRGNPIHPNDKGHEAIAKAMLNAYRRALNSASKIKQKSRG